MHSSLFLFTPGIWIGEGTIYIGTASTPIRFFTKWTIQLLGKDRLEAIQRIELQGVAEHITNRYLVSEIHATSFSLTWDTALSPPIHGIGCYSTDSLTWSLMGEEGFQGEEYYLRQNDGSFVFQATYGTDDAFGTRITGHLWLKTLV